MSRVMSEPLQLHTTPPLWGMPSISPACSKLETWFRMAGVEYEKPPLAFQEAPKGKIPFVVIGGERMGDSTLIIEHMRETRGIDLDAPLSPRERAISMAFRRMLKENTYWAIIRHRYFVDENWEQYRGIVGGLLAPGAPDEMKAQVAEGIKAGADSDARGQGYGRHTLEEAKVLYRHDLQAVSDLLGDNEWMMGHDTPTVLDATAFAYVGSFACAPFDDDMGRFAKGLTNLVAHCDRMRARYFPELVEAKS